MVGITLKGLEHIRGLTAGSLDYSPEESPNNIQVITQILVENLVEGKYQPRTSFNNQLLEELAASIKEDGILQPLLVRELRKDKYEIVAGERRFLAAKLANLTSVPAIVKKIDNQTALAFALIENIQRESLNAIDESLSLYRLKEEFELTHEEIAKRVGRSRSAVTNLIRLVALHDSIKILLADGLIEMGHARSLLSLRHDDQQKVAHTIIDNKLSVRETEKLIKNMNADESIKENKFDQNIDLWTSALTGKLSSKVKIKLNVNGRGHLIINIQSPEEIEKLISRIK
ncbi:MAG: ParB/RepB/Spo0J family partition protein [Gammaproteobacteria bacterium]